MVLPLSFSGEYGQNSCFGRNCPRCGDGVIPSCVGLPDGQNPFPGYDNRYLVCRMDRTVETRTCNPGELFSQNLRGCSTSGSGLANRKLHFKVKFYTCKYVYTLRKLILHFYCSEAIF